MGIDEDFPMTRTQVKALVVGLVVMGAFGAALFGGLIPGLKPNYAQPQYFMIDGKPYYYTTVTLTTPGFFANQTAPQSFAFHNVTFALWLSHWGLLSGGLVLGNGTEANGTVYPFALGESVSPPVNSSFFLSPDRVFAVAWPGGLLASSSVQLYVRF